MSEEVPVTPSTGNVFADLQLDNPEEERLKAQLVREIRDILIERGLTQARAGDLLGLQQPDVSMLVNGQTKRFSIERLLRCLRRLDHGMSIVIARSDDAKVRDRAVSET